MLLKEESRFILDSEGDYSWLLQHYGDPPCYDNLQLVLLSLLAAPDVCHPSLSIFCCFLVANIQLKFFLMSFFFIFFTPRKGSRRALLFF